jgi:hypothetical protein
MIEGKMSWKLEQEWRDQKTQNFKDRHQFTTDPAVDMASTSNTLYLLAEPNRNIIRAAR